MKAFAAGLCLLGFMSSAVWAEDPFESAPVPDVDPFRAAPAQPAAKPMPRPRPEPQSQAPAVDADLSAWTTIQNSTNPADFESYLRLFPQGRFADAARARIAALGPSAPPGAIVARSGVDTRVARHVHHNSRCMAQPPPITIVEQPKHGTATVRDETVTVQTNASGSTNCIGMSMPGRAVYYRPAPEFKGIDQFVYEATLGRATTRRTVNVVVR